MSRRVCRLVALLAAAAAAAGAVPYPAAGESAPADRPQLKMEEIEVRGAREKPGTLFVPAAPPVAPVHRTQYDYFLEDLARPITPRQVADDNILAGGHVDYRYAPD